MSEALEAAATALREKFAGADIEGSVPIDVEDEGVIHRVDGVLSMNDGEAYVTLSS
jgi:hypothetical protein